MTTTKSKRKRAKTAKEGIIKAGVVETEIPPRWNQWDHVVNEDDLEDGLPIWICPSCGGLFTDDPTVKEAVCDVCERTLRKYACIANPEHDEAKRLAETDR